MQSPPPLEKKVKNEVWKLEVTPVRVDLNAHILPEIHSNSICLSESLVMARSLCALGINKVIATPLIPPGTFENVEAAHRKLTNGLKENAIRLRVEVAAQYLVTEDLREYLLSGKGLHCFGTKSGRPFLLMKANELEEPKVLEEIILLLNKKNIVPLLAQPENYAYLQRNFDRAIELFRLGARFQINWGSLRWNEHKPSQQLTEKLIDYRMVSFLATNTQSKAQIPLLVEAAKQAYFALLIETGLINNKLA
jgi:protein-tyrosine phosphatase